MQITLHQMNRGMDVCPLAKDRAISALVMRSERPMEDISDRIPVAGDDEDSPFMSSRKLTQARKGRDMAIYI